MAKATGKIILQVFAVATFVVTLVSAGTSEITSGVNGDIYPNQMVYLGAADGKQYFLDNSYTMSWEDADAQCQSFHMRLASVQTLAQSQFLEGAIRQNIGGHMFAWTSGREFLGPANFRWTDTEAVLNEQALGPWEYHSYDYCVLIYVRQQSGYFYTTRPCSAHGYPLCSTV